MVVQFILFNFANYSPSIAMELTKKLRVNEKIGDSRQTNMSLGHFFLGLHTAEIHFEKLLG